MTIESADRTVQLEQKLDVMSAQLDTVVAELREQRLRREQWQELISDLGPIASEAMDMASRELEAVQDWVEPLYIGVRFSGADTKKIISIVQERWEEQIQEIPFEYEFLDAHYEGIYRNEMQTRALLFIFAGIAIFISCLGLFGLASFMAERRTKEIGIRKTNGATTANILRLLSLDFTKWVLLANIIAWPLTWFAMKKWLESFAYRVDIPLWIYAVAGILAFVIAMATVSFHAVRASRQNPGISLRYE